MPQLKWTGSGIFTDHNRNFKARPEGVYDVSDEQADDYLNHDQFGDDWEEASDADADNEDVVEGTAATAADDTPHVASESDDEEGDGDGDGDGGETTDAPFSPGDKTVDELESELSDGDYSDEELDAILEAESSDKDRGSAKDAIESQRE